VYYCPGFAGWGRRLLFWPPASSCISCFWCRCARGGSTRCSMTPCTGSGRGASCSPSTRRPAPPQRGRREHDRLRAPRRGADTSQSRAAGLRLPPPGADPAARACRTSTTHLELRIVPEANPTMLSGFAPLAPGHRAQLRRTSSASTQQRVWYNQLPGTRRPRKRRWTTRSSTTRY
jgi:hypothetical protein